MAQKDLVDRDNAANHARRLAIIRYMLAARAYRKCRDDYRAVESARAAMVAAVGLPVVSGFMGEFCNLHERDIPGQIHATYHPCSYDRTAAAVGRVYRYSGFQQPITWADHQANGAKVRRRSLHLQRMFELPPVERFLSGWPAVYADRSGGVYAVTWCAGRRDGAPFATFHQAVGFGWRKVQQPIIGRDEAARFFSTLPPDTTFQPGIEETPY